MNGWMDSLYTKQVEQVSEMCPNLLQTALQEFLAAVALLQSCLPLPSEVEVELCVRVEDQLQLYPGTALCTDSLGWTRSGRGHVISVLHIIHEVGGAT